MNTYVFGVLCFCAIPLHQHLMALGLSEKWQRRDRLRWIGNNSFQKRLEVSGHTLDCLAIKQIRAVLEKPHEYTTTLAKIQREVKWRCLRIHLHFTNNNI